MFLLVPAYPGMPDKGDKTVCVCVSNGCERWLAVCHVVVDRRRDSNGIVLHTEGLRVSS